MRSTATACRRARPLCLVGLVIAAAAILLAACGSDDEPTTVASASSTPAASSTTTGAPPVPTPPPLVTVLPGDQPTPSVTAPPLVPVIPPDIVPPVAPPVSTSPPPGPTPTPDPAPTEPGQSQGGQGQGPSVTLVPGGPYHEGDQVTVVVSGFAPGSTVLIEQCLAGVTVDSVINDCPWLEYLELGSIDAAVAALSVPVDDQGQVRHEITMRRMINLLSGSIDCASTECVVAVAAADLAIFFSGGDAPVAVVPVELAA